MDTVQKNYSELFFRILLSLSSIIVVAVYIRYLALNGSKPLWFDEAWRSYLISSNFDISEIDQTGLAPISLGQYLVVKFASLFYDSAFTQRIHTYLSLFGTFPLLYLIGKKLINKYFGLIVLCVIPFTPYYFEYAISNKPFMMDIFFTLLILYISIRFFEGTVHFRVFLFVTFFSVLFSFAMPFIFAGIGLYWLSVIYFTKQRKSHWIRHFIWASSTIVLLIVYYNIFVFPQITEGLNEWWQDFSGDRSSVIGIVKFLGINLFGMFNIDYGNTPNIQGWYLGGILPTTGQAVTSNFLSQTFAICLLISFFAGVVRMIYDKKRLLPIILISSTSVMFLFSLLGFWPFGNNRVNTFLFALMAIVALYFLYEWIILLYKKISVVSILFVTLLTGLFYPYVTIYNNVTQESGIAFLDGMEEMTMIVATQASPDDLILVYHDLSRLSFLYHYQYNSFSRSESMQHPQILFDSWYSPLTMEKAFFDILDNEELWIISAINVPNEKIISSSSHSYRIIGSYEYRTVYLWHLEKITQ